MRSIELPSREGVQVIPRSGLNLSPEGLDRQGERGEEGFVVLSFLVWSSLRLHGVHFVHNHNTKV